MKKHVALTIEQFAEVMAHEEHFGAEQADEVRRRLGVDRGWDTAFSHWTDALERDLDAVEDAALAPVFGERFGATKQRLRDEQPAIASLEPIVEVPPAPAPQEPQDGSTLEPSADQGFDGTAFVSALVIEDALPFEQGEAAPPPAPSAAPVASPDVGQTAFVGTAGGAGPTLPFGLDIDEEVRQRLTLEQYASLCAELEAAPHQRQPILARYKLDENTHRVLDEAWRKHLQEEPADRARFDQALTSYRDWLRRPR